MTAMTETKKERLGIKPAPRNLNEAELKEFLALIDMVAVEKFKTIQIQNNTALIPRGQEVAKEQEAVSRLLENVKDQWMSAKLNECGVEQGVRVSIDPKTGEIKKVEENVPNHDNKTA